MHLLSHVFAVLSLATGTVVYGADMFALLVLRPALKHLDEHGLTTTMGHIHHYGDQRLPIPFATAVLAAVLAAITAGFADRPAAAIASGVAVLSLLVWVVIYAMVAAPVNRALTAAAHSGHTAPEARQLQRRWDRAVPFRASLQLLALVAQCIALAIT